MIMLTAGDQKHADRQSPSVVENVSEIGDYQHECGHDETTQASLSASIRHVSSVFL